MQKLHFLIIDPQNSFMDRNNDLVLLQKAGINLADIGLRLPEPELPVPGAYEDSERLAMVLNRLRGKITGIHVTLDTHQLLDISHPLFWMNSAGEHPGPFTLISLDDLNGSVWTPTSPDRIPRARAYLQALQDNDRYLLCIWPPHCKVGTWGHNVVDVVNAELEAWEESRKRRINYVTKGHNPWTEHYSGVIADVPDDEDPTTQLNVTLLKLLKDADIIALSGQALSHCVANTVKDIADNFGEENIKKLVLLEDTSSNVTGFEKLGTDFVTEMVSRGMQICKAEDFLK